jgi:hypothetical protein
MVNDSAATRARCRLRLRHTALLASGVLTSALRAEMTEAFVFWFGQPFMVEDEMPVLVLVVLALVVFVPAAAWSVGEGAIPACLALPEGLCRGWFLHPRRRLVVRSAVTVRQSLYGWL